jgi:hypothetical protein
MPGTMCWLWSKLLAPLTIQMRDDGEKVAGRYTHTPAQDEQEKFPAHSIIADLGCPWTDRHHEMGCSRKTEIFVV